MRQWRTIGASQPVQGSTYCSVGMIIAQAVWRETRSKSSVKWRRILKTCVVAFSITQSAFPVSWTNFASLNEIRRKGRLIVTKPWVTGISAQEQLLRSRKSLRTPPLRSPNSLPIPSLLSSQKCPPSNTQAFRFMRVNRQKSHQFVVLFFRVENFMLKNSL